MMLYGLKIYEHLYCTALLVLLSSISPLGYKSHTFMQHIIICSLSDFFSNQQVWTVGGWKPT